MDWVSCKIALAGDQLNIMFRGADVPVSWPEVRVLQQIHGEESVFDCDFLGAEPSNVQTEKMRLLGIYGAEAVNLVYPGQRPMMEMEFPGDRDPAGQKRPERRPIPENAEPSAQAQVRRPARTDA